MAVEPRRYEVLRAEDHSSQGRTYLARDLASGTLARLWVPETDLNEEGGLYTTLASESELLAPLDQPSMDQSQALTMSRTVVEHARRSALS